VVKTSVDLSRQDEGDEMFGSSPIARTLVRSGNSTAKFVARIVPKKLLNWIDSRFNSDEMHLPQGAAFDMIRAAVNLVLAGLLVAIGTSLKLPLSTTYVTFMVAMGTSLADRAWGRESAVFRITGVLSVIGGWFITAGAAFIFCFLLTNLMYFGSYAAMLLSIILAVYLLVGKTISKTPKENLEEEKLFLEIQKSKDTKIVWTLLCKHIRNSDNIKDSENQNKYKAEVFFEFAERTESKNFCCFKRFHQFARQKEQSHNKQYYRVACRR
jgi:phosphate/sulfate permease